MTRGSTGEATGIMPEPSPSFETALLHADALTGPDVVLPIYQASTFAFDDAAAMRDAAQEPRSQRFYTRYGNPNHAAAQAIVAELEGAETAMISASGMGAISAAALTLLRSGDHVIAQRQLYASTRSLAVELLARFGIQTTLVDQTDTEAFEHALRPNTKLLMLETPSNPLSSVTDLAAVCARAAQHGAVSIVDNTVATPYNQRPLDFGADLVVHSATKYLGGHSDLIAGVVAGRRELLDRIWQTHIMLGAVAAPFDAWLLCRGLRTLELRMARHNASALAIARFLEAHRRVSRVYYAGLESHPQHQLAARQMRGFSGLMSFEVDGDFESAQRVAKALKLARYAVSLGGVESLIAQPASMWPDVGRSADAAALGVTPSLLRFSCGIERTEDLIADFESALAQA